MNWDAERDMAQDVRKNKLMYEALGGGEDELRVCDAPQTNSTGQSSHSGDDEQ